MSLALAEAAEQQTTEQYRFVDDVPGAYQERLLVRQAAERLLDSRRTLAANTGQEYAPVDALSTAHSVLTAEQRFGEGSEQHEQKWDALLLDCQRLVGEWYRKNTAEYFEPVRHTFDTERADFLSHGLSIRQMTENALVPITEDPEEEMRRVNERVEEATPFIMRNIGRLALGQGIVTISECTDSAISSYRADIRSGAKHRGYRGYVPEIEKLMIRHMSLDPETNDRFETQIGLPGIYLTHETIQIALVEKGIDASHMGKTQLHGSQLLVSGDPMEFVQHLDNVASEQWCTNIFMGEQVDDDFVKDYELFKTEALKRKENLQAWSETVALFVLDLAREGFDRTKAPLHVEEFVKNLLLNIAKSDQAVAEQMFDIKTADGLRQVVLLEQQGRFDEAQALWLEVEKNAPGGGSCGAGNCGLEGVNGGSKEDKELRKKLGAEDGDIIVRDKERSCKCGSKSIVYAYNKNKVIKYCESCKANEKTYKKAA